MYAPLINVMFQGTPPFMAIAVLSMEDDTGYIHHAKYDLESLMYVAFYCATMLKGPNGNWREESDFKVHTSVPLREWFDLRRLKGSYRSMGRIKIGHMTTFDTSVLKKMDPFFSPLFPGFRQLRDAFFPPGTDTLSYFDSCITHPKMIAIFNDILTNLSEEHTTKRGLKRSLSSESIQSPDDAELNVDLY
jgi:hypothetical protein